jgi:hypothetical protein
LPPLNLSLLSLSPLSLPPLNLPPRLNLSPLSLSLPRLLNRLQKNLTKAIPVKAERHPDFTFHNRSTTSANLSQVE